MVEVRYLSRKPVEDAYRGLSPEEARRLSLELIRHAGLSGHWAFLAEHLLALRSQMVP